MKMGSTTRIGMNIGILSDLHVDHNNAEGDQTVQEALARVARERDTDLLIVAGDVSNDYELTLNVLREIEDRAGVPCLFVPGNHDLWNILHPDRDAWKIHDALQAFERNLAAAPYEIGTDWVVIGDSGWYDFSFGDPRFGPEKFAEMEHGKRVWKDKLYAKWDRSPGEVSEYFRLKLKDQLEWYRDRNVILVTHVVPDERLTVPTPNAEWEYFNAFLGSRSYGELIRQYGGSVKYAVSGHVHYRKRLQAGDTELICNCLGDKREWRHSERTYEEIDRAFVTITLD